MSRRCTATTMTAIFLTKISSTPTKYSTCRHTHVTSSEVLYVTPRPCVILSQPIHQIIRKSGALTDLQLNCVFNIQMIGLLLFQLISSELSLYIVYYCKNSNDFNPHITHTRTKNQKRVEFYLFLQVLLFVFQFYYSGYVLFRQC